MSPRLAVIGPVQEPDEPLAQAITDLLRDADIRQVIYLGADDVVDRTIDRLAGAGDDRRSFLQRAADVACAGDATAIDALLTTERARRELQRVRRLPAPPARAVEMLEQWVMLAVYDKAILDEEDIANAHVILYGKSIQPTVKAFGPRCFFTPGPLSAGHVGVLEVRDDGDLEIQIRDLTGAVVSRERVQRGGGKVLVTG